MSYTAIADVGSMLIKLLTDNMALDDNSIALLSPVDVQNQTVRLSLFLYNITENSHLKNQEPFLSLDTLRYPPLMLDLYYMLTAYSAMPAATKETLEQQRLLGRAMRILYDNAIVSGSVLPQSLAGQELRIIFNPLSLEDLNQIWGTYNDFGYTLSVSYLVTPVRIDSLRELSMQRVVSKDANYLIAEPEE